ncbi:efflux RND transporter periplasmic adaptor subunit [Candidatus Clostridium radicumherbarum]|uniref:Efflux RND transporter periplasmic adaptor subunit n=1 Tax=Candidatus Clostridium radicumherbarum TaxID=3381662 RepID=A0ABW8TP42_9CLOT
MKSKLIKTIIACVIVACVAVGGYYGYNKFIAAKPVKAASQYLTVNARTMNMQVTIQGTGAAYAAVSKDIMANNNGTLKDLNVKIGDTVAAGAKLFTSDSDDLRKNVTSAQNNLNKQNLTLASDKQALANAQAAVTAAASTTASSSNDKSSSQNGGQSNQNPQDAVLSAQNKVSMDQLSLSDAQSQLSSANVQLSKAVVAAPIGGVITVVNNSNGDAVSPGKAVVSIVDMSSLKIKVQVDELDIDKVKTGQKAQITFDAVKDKTFDGTVETIAQTGTSNNNVTTYDVVVDITDPTGIKIGMNANVSIQVDSKDNALVVPSEAVIDRNGQKFVMVPSSSTTTGTGSSNNNPTSQNNSGNNGQSTNGSNGQSTNRSNGQSSGSNGQQGSSGQNRRSGSSYGTSSAGKLVRVQTGLENENYVEITQGLNDGDKVLIQLPQTSSSTNSSNRNGLSTGFGGGSFGGGGFGGGGNFSGGGNRQQTSGGGNNASKGN